MDNQDKGVLQMCRKLWHDYQDGIIDYETLQVEEYAREYGVGKVPRHLLAPILLKRAEPIEEDAEKFKTEANLYRKLKRKPDQENEKQERLTEAEAIELLKRKGYRVMKKTIAYIDL